MSNIKIITNFPIAVDSPDHILPLGTKWDNSHNLCFVKKCEKWLIKKGKKRGLILDIGCAGGRCVEDFIEKGHLAYGIEGSDYSKKNKRASWGSVPNHLFTCDASRPFTVVNNNMKILKFDIIISFEVMEHIPKKRLYQYFKNIKNHLLGNGLFIGSFTTTKSKKFPQYHQTIMNKKGWYRFVKKLGWFDIINLKWKKKDYLRHSPLAANCIPICFILKKKTK